MFRLWLMTEADLLDPSSPYHLRYTTTTCLEHLYIYTLKQKNIGRLSVRVHSLMNMWWCVCVCVFVFNVF